MNMEDQIAIASEIRKSMQDAVWAAGLAANLASEAVARVDAAVSLLTTASIARACGACRAAESMSNSAVRLMGEWSDLAAQHGDHVMSGYMLFASKAEAEVVISTMGGWSDIHAVEAIIGDDDCWVIECDSPAREHGFSVIEDGGDLYLRSDGFVR